MYDDQSVTLLSYSIGYLACPWFGDMHAKPSISIVQINLSEAMKDSTT